MFYGRDFQTVEAENNRRLNPPEVEPTYEEKLEQLDEKELIELLVTNKKESLVLEIIIETLTKRYNALIKKRNDLNEKSPTLLNNKNPYYYADGIALCGLAKAVTNEIAEFLTDNLDQNYDYSKELKELVRFNSIEV